MLTLSCPLKKAMKKMKTQLDQEIASSFKSLIKNFSSRPRKGPKKEWYPHLYTPSTISTIWTMTGTLLVSSPMT